MALGVSSSPIGNDPDACATVHSDGVSPMISAHSQGNDGPAVDGYDTRLAVSQIVPTRGPDMTYPRWQLLNTAGSWGFFRQ